MVVNLPEELLDCIANYIDSRGDLISLALTCSSFCRVIVPTHLHRSVAVSITNPDHLLHVATDPSLAANILEVTLVNTAFTLPAKQCYEEPLPRLSGSFPEDIIPKTKAALRLLPRLLSLRLNSGTGGTFSISEETLNALVEKHVTRLERVSLDVATPHTSSFLLWKTQDLRTLELVYVHRLAWDDFANVLVSSPQLEVLGLPTVYVYDGPLPDPASLPTVPPLPHLPNLRSLSMPGWSDPAIGRSLIAFLCAHPLVADLRWKSVWPPSLADMPPLTYLRRIREGATSAHFAARFLEGKPPSSVRLHTLECYHLGVRTLSLGTLRALDPDALRTVRMQEGTLQDVKALAQAFPNIENIELSSVPMLDTFIRSFMRLVDLMELFPALRVAYGVNCGFKVLAPNAPPLLYGSFARISHALCAVRAAHPALEVVNGWRLDDRLAERVVCVRIANKQDYGSMAPVNVRTVLREDGYSRGYTEPSLKSFV